MYEEIRVMNTPTLISIAEDSATQGYRRIVEPEWVRSNADPDGVHVASILVLNLREEWGGKHLRQHHTVEIIMRNLEGGPEVFVSDVSSGMWSWLYTPDEWKMMTEESNKPNPDFSSVCRKFSRETTS